MPFIIGIRRGLQNRSASVDPVPGASSAAPVHATELAEDYVELIGDLIAELGEARLTDVAKALGVAQPTAGKVVERLKTQGLVEGRRYRSLFLTAEGERMADRSRRRYQLVVEFLCSLGVSRDAAEIDAEGIEHHVSAETLQAFARGIGR